MAILMVMAAAGFALLIFYGAFRIILGWIVPAATAARFDRGVGAFFGFVSKASIVGAAGVLAWFFYAYVGH